MAFPFMDVNEYRLKYPDACKMNFAAEPSSTRTLSDRSFVYTRTATQVVQEFSVKGQGQIGTVHYAETEEPNTNTGVSTFVCRGRLMKFTGEGRAKNKKTAKQIASYEILKSAIMMDRYKDFQFPADTIEEALAILDKHFKPCEDEANTSGGTAQPDNWVGNLLEFCTQNKLPLPEYSFTETGPTNCKTFTTFAKVGETEKSGEGKTKKASKTAASQKLLEALRPQILNLNKERENLEGGGGEEDEEEEELSGLLATPGVDVSQAHLDPEPQQTLAALLADESRFRQGCSCVYRDIQFPSSRGRTQSLLTVKYSQATPQAAANSEGRVMTPRVDKDAPSESTYVFCGEGGDNRESRDEAARAALVHFATFRAPATAAPTPASVSPPIPADA